MKINGNLLFAEESSTTSTKSQLPLYPLRDDALDINDELKIELIEEKFRDIVEILGFDLAHDSIQDTPKRVAKMYVNEIFKGLNPKNKPEITLFKNSYAYHSPLVELNIPFTSFCEHHFVPIQGKASIAYMPRAFVIGLSKLHRLVDYFARRPQVQERLTMQIYHELATILEIEDIGVVLKANHSCISCRGVEDQGSSTLSSVFQGKIKNDSNLISLLIGNNSC